MKIKKTSETTPTMASVVDDYAASIQDAYSCSFINDMNNYHTSEFNTHKKWIDGKYIYRKVITGTTSSSQDYTETSLNFETIVSIIGGLISGSYFNPCGAYFASDNYVNCYAYINKVAISNSSNYRNKPYYLIVEYTKTTD